jgi:hypothetical protein
MLVKTVLLFVYLSGCLFSSSSLPLPLPYRPCPSAPLPRAFNVKPISWSSLSCIVHLSPLLFSTSIHPSINLPLSMLIVTMGWDWNREIETEIGPNELELELG